MSKWDLIGTHGGGQMMKCKIISFNKLKGLRNMGWFNDEDASQTEHVLAMNEANDLFRVPV